jgi:hypothetical protein
MFSLMRGKGRKGITTEVVAKTILRMHTKGG